MRVGEQEGVVPGPSICFSVVSYDLKSRSFKLNINIFITFEMPRVVYIMSNVHWQNFFAIPLELVSKELNHMAAIMQVYAGGLNFSKRKWKYFNTFIIFIVKSLQKEQNSTKLLHSIWSYKKRSYKKHW